MKEVNKGERDGGSREEAMSWLKQLVAGISTAKPGACLRPEWQWDRLATSTSDFPCQYHSTNGPESFSGLKPTPYTLSNFQRR
jgi:hypothetical protein